MIWRLKLMRRRTDRVAWMLVLSGTFAVGGCSRLTEVDATDVVEPPALRTPAGANALFSGALTLFSAAYNGDASNANVTLSAVVVSGLLTDELGTANVDIPVDSRTADGSSQTQGLYTALSQARVSALAAAQVMQAVLPVARARIGELFAVVGYAELLLGELYCPGTTLTTVSDGAPVTYGEPLTNVQVFERALVDFDTALVYGADSAAILNLARVGRGRTLAALGRFAEATSTLAPVPTQYVFVTEHAATVQPNRLATGFAFGLYTVSDREGQNGIAFRSAGDPRVRTAFVRRGFDGVTDVWGLTTLAAGAATPTVLASGIEARLIQAEAALRANPNDNATTGTGWLGILNTLRSGAITPAMAPLADPGNFAARVDLLFRERAFWLFATAHRLGDLRRLVREYSRNAELVFPTGTYRSGITYGTDVILAPSLVTESLNPKYRGCLDRNP